MPRPRPPWFAACLLAAAVFAAVPAAAEDVIHLRNGAPVKGRIVSEDDKHFVVEQRVGGGFSSITVPKAFVARVERGPEPLAAGPSAPAMRPAAVGVRDEWFLLESDAKVVGTRHVLSQPLDPSSTGGLTAGKGVKIEEQVALFGTPRFPAVLVQRIEDVGEDWLPRHLFYRERGDAGTGPGAPPAYETIRSGEVKGGVWSVAERLAGGARDVGIAVPAGAQSPLAAREALARADPRVAGLAEIALIDPARGEVRRVRAGFSSLGAKSAAGEGREDVLRVEDGDAVRESRWAAGPEVRCLREEVAPGVVAVAATAAQAEGATRAAGSPVAGGVADPKGAEKRTFALPEIGIALVLPGASWEAKAIPVRREQEGLRAVAKIASAALVADVRVEWDPRGASASPGPPPPAGTDPVAAEAESTLLVRLRGIAPDLEIVEPRRAVPGVAGAFRMTLRGTVRKERLKTAVLVADRGGARVVLLASCPEAAWDDTRGALEAVLDSFRWL